jgi:hypothetical protein
MRIGRLGFAVFVLATSAGGWVNVPSSNLFSVQTYGARGDCSADDSDAIIKAATAAVFSMSKGKPAAIYFPAGCYLYKAGGLPTWRVPVSVVGDGHLKSIIKVDPAFSGDVFSWSEVWNGDSFPHGGNVIRDISKLATAPVVEGVSITGDRAAPSQQNAFVFYDRVDELYMNDVQVNYLNGRCFHVGVLKNSTQAWMRESHLQNIRFFNCGATNAPVVDIGSLGTGDNTNTNIIYGLDIYAPYGTGLILRGNRPGTAVSGLKIVSSRFEGLENGTSPVDLMQIGDPTQSGNINHILLEQVDFIDPYPDHAGLRITGVSLATAPYEIHCMCNFGGGLANGKGLAIDAGRYLYFHITGMLSKQTNITVAPNKTVGGPLMFDGELQEESWTWEIDPSSASLIHTPVWRRGNPSIR